MPGPVVEPHNGQYSKFRVRWTEGGKRVTRYFKTKSEAERERTKVRAELQRKAPDSSPFTDSEIQAVMAARAAGIDLHAALQAFQSTAAARASSITISTLIQRRRDSAEKEGLSQRYRDNLRLRLSKFDDAFGARLASDITPQDIHEFLAALHGGAETRRTYRNLIGGVFNYGINLEICAANPAKLKTRARRRKRGKIGILTPAEARALMLAADPRIQPGIIIATFAGLRPESEIWRIQWTQVHRGRAFIEVIEGKGLTASRRLVTIQPALRAFLDSIFPDGWPTAGPVWPTVAITARRLYRNARTAAGFVAPAKPWPQDGLRHSFASYHYAAFSDAAKTAQEMGHMTTDMLFTHYRELVTKQQAKAFWALRP